MSVGLHVALYRIFEIARSALPIVLCCGLVSVVQLWDASPGSHAFLVAAILAPLVIGLSWWIVPLRCTTEWCAGRMRCTTKRISFWRVEATYRCEDCGAVQVERILSPDFEISVEFGG